MTHPGGAGTFRLAAITPLSDFGTWARTSLLIIVMLVTGAVLISRFVSWGSRRVTERIDSRAVGGDALVRSEEAKHRHAAVDVLTWTFLGLLYLITFVLVLEKLGIPLTTLVAPATVAGVALGFGAQRVVQDVLAGFLIVSERQYGFGDVVRISQLGQTTGVTGTVEEVTLRITRLRTTDGEVVFVPNGQIVQATNLSRDWARAVVDVPVPVTADISTVTGVLKEAGEAAFADEELRPLLLDEPTVMGVESISVDQFDVRVVARTLPGKQFKVGRILRSRIAIALRAAGITVPLEVDSEQTSEGGQR
jgi:small conductance mechanosensitive channel